MVITRSQRFDTYDPVGRFEAEDLDAGTESAVQDLDQIGDFSSSENSSLEEFESKETETQSMVDSQDDSPASPFCFTPSGEERGERERKGSLRSVFKLSKPISNRSQSCDLSNAGAGVCNCLPSF
jgi:hypothetical protein